MLAGFEMLKHGRITEMRNTMCYVPNACLRHRHFIGYLIMDFFQQAKLTSQNGKIDFITDSRGEKGQVSCLNVPQRVFTTGYFQQVTT